VPLPGERGKISQLQAQRCLGAEIARVERRIWMLVKPTRLTKVIYDSQDRYFFGMGEYDFRRTCGRETVRMNCAGRVRAFSG
jgi:hypothetical protein